MADTITNVTIFHQRGTDSDSVEEELILDESSVSPALDALAARLQRIAGGLEGGTVAVRVDSATAVAATGSIDNAQASATAGDTLSFVIPGISTPFTLTAVAGSATAADGEYSIDTGDEEMRDSLVLAINGLPGLRDHISAAADGSDASLCNLTAKRTGTAGNSIVITKAVTSAGAHTITAMSGGLAITDKPSIDITFGSADITANDTISVGGRKYTWKASASADGEITLSTTEATAATNFAAAINADATWTGLITATRDDAVVTLTWDGDPRVGQHVVVTVVEANSGSVSPGGTVMMTLAEAFVDSTTVTGNSVTRRYKRGGV